MSQNMSDSNETVETGARRSFSRFLIETEIKPLVIIGKAIQAFGMAATGSYVLGAACLYGYGLFAGSLPGIKPAIPEAREIDLFGKVTTLDDEPLKEGFRVMVLDSAKSESGPFQRKDGSFQVRVPLNQSRQYRLLILTEDNQALMLSPVLDALESQGRYQLSGEIVVPTELGRIAGQIVDQEGRPFDGYIKVGDTEFKRTDSNGSYLIKNLPPGKIPIEVKRNFNDKTPLFKSELQLGFEGFVSRDLTVGVTPK
jgi:hypothetical protein